MYYVYALIDPRNNLPFYIGKGKGSRRHAHFKACNLKNRHYKNSKIKSIQESGLEVGNEVLFEGLTEEEAYTKEIELISHYGRIINGTGILTNITPGGISDTSHMKYERTSKHRKAIANSNKTRTRTQEEREKRSAASKGEKNPMYGRVHSEAARAKMSEAHLASKRCKGDRNPKAKLIHIRDGSGKVVFKCAGNFEATCKENNLPYYTLSESMKKGGIPIFMKKTSVKFPHCKGWSAVIVS